MTNAINAAQEKEFCEETDSSGALAGVNRHAALGSLPNRKG